MRPMICATLHSDLLQVRPIASPVRSGKSALAISRLLAAGCLPRMSTPSGWPRASSCSTLPWPAATQVLRIGWCRICCSSVRRHSLLTVTRFPICVRRAKHSTWIARRRWITKHAGLADSIPPFWPRRVSAFRQRQKPGRHWPGEIATSSSLRQTSSVWCATPCANCTVTVKAWPRH